MKGLQPCACIQAELVTSLVDIQRETTQELVETRRQIAVELRRFMAGESVDEETVLRLAERYGDLDGEIVYYYATHFSDVSRTLTSAQEDELMSIRGLEEFPFATSFP
ncbi:MAG: hypothetical protein JXQ75_10885 [Phycisphaerae bacterium]|nr:hypothetical protein [Phycisphaerae bacterium]